MIAQQWWNNIKNSVLIKDSPEIASYMRVFIVSILEETQAVL